MQLDDAGIRATLANVSGGAVPLRVRIIDGIEGLNPQDRQRLRDAGITPTKDLDGFVSGSTLVVNKRNVNTATQVGVLAAHEILGHVGLRALHGNRLNTELDNYFRQLGGARKIAELGQQYGVSLPDQYGALYKGALNGDPQARRALVQELLAAAAETNYLRGDRTVAQGISDFVSRVKGFLARFPGLGKLFDTMSERDIMRVVRDSAKAAKQLSERVAPIDTAASIGAVSRVAGIAKEDFAVITPDGETFVTKSERRVRQGADLVRGENVTQTIDDVTGAAREAIRTRTLNTFEKVLGATANQISPKQNPLRRGPDAGKARAVLGEASWIVKLQENFADSQERMRRASNAVRKVFNQSPDTLAELGARIDETLQDILLPADRNTSTQTDFFGESQSVAEARRLADLRADLRKSTHSNVQSDLSDAMAVYTKAQRYRGLAMEQSRNELVDLDIRVDESLESLAAELGVSIDEAKRSANGVMYALSSLEKNAASYLLQSPVDAVGASKRARLLERYEALNNDGATLSAEFASKMKQDLEAIGRQHYNGPTDYDLNASEVNTTGMSTAAATQLLDAAGVSAKNLGTYQGVIDAARGHVDATLRMRNAILPQAYFNERALFGFTHDYPTDTVDTGDGGFPLYVNEHTIKSHDDFQNAEEQQSQLSGNPLDDVRIQSVLASQSQHYNAEMMRSLAMNVIASRGDDTFRTASNGFFDVKQVELVSKNSKAFRDWSTNKLDETESKDTFMYAVPNSDAAVLIRFDNISNSPVAIRGERKGEQMRQTNTFKALRVANGAMSRMMTRYNLNFLPRSHVREHIIGALTLSSEQGLGAAKDFLGKALDNNVMLPEIYTYMRLRNTRTRESEAERNAMLQTSQVARDLQDLIDNSGLVTQLSALSEPGQADITKRNTSSGLAKGAQGFENYLGSASDATDALVRLSLYQTRLQQGASKQEAADYAKRFANFESRGKYSGPLGDAIMFFNPTAVSASRAVETLLEGEYARPTMMAAVGAGIAYQVLGGALFGGEEDNLFDREGMDRQTTDLRIPLSDDTTFSIPAGFGPASAAFLVGNQLGAMLRGKQDMMQLAANSYEILTTNFAPVPASGIPLVDSQGNVNIGKYVVDTFTPAALKPVGQFFANMNGLGLPIYRQGNSLSAGGLTDAFNGRESDVGTWSERMAVAMHESTGGALDVNPGTLRHFMTSYFNAVNVVMDMGAEVYNLTDGVEAGHAFVDRSVGFGGFFSRTGKQDDYYKSRRKVDAIYKQLRTYENTGRTEAAEKLRARLPANFDEIRKAINRNKSAQDKANTELRPIIYGVGSQGEKAAAIQQLNDRRELLQEEGLKLTNLIVQPNG